MCCLRSSFELAPHAVHVGLFISPRAAGGPFRAVPWPAQRLDYPVPQSVGQLFRRHCAGRAPQIQQERGPALGSVEITSSWSVMRSRLQEHWLICQHHHSLQNRSEAHEYHEQLEQLRKSAVGSKLFNRPKTDRADHNDNQNPNHK